MLIIVVKLQLGSP